MREGHPQSGQLLLDFPLDPVLLWDNLVVGRHNEVAIAAVQSLERAGAPGLILTGEAGVGKSHLLQAAVQGVRDQHDHHAAVYLDLASLDRHMQGHSKESGEALLARFVDRYGNCKLAAIDELELLEDAPALQEAVLYLYNSLRRAGGHLLGAGRKDPSAMLGLRDDLRSRLLWGAVMPIEQPDETALAGIMAKLADDRQLKLSDALSHFLLMRLPRSVPLLLESLETLDREALKLQRPLTVPLAKEVLGL
uniref:Putative regulatory inactivation of DnaA/Hda protein n=1 Tax=Magnetococcus massalia (strain MO-1) TaxID=451514 RepID=A0A1S7LGW4_MAGMO|nr:putative regulatory inactivation of DnaA/Hda protein [Candidatus Magnetococcus massalia]